MLILILIDVQYSQEPVFSFEKGSNRQNHYLKNQNTTDWNNYKYQRIICTDLLPKTKFDYFRNLNVKELNDKKIMKKNPNLSLLIKV